MIDDHAAEDWLVAALAHARNGERDWALPWYDKAVRWLEGHPNKDPMLCGLRAEADGLLGNPARPLDPPP